MICFKDLIANDNKLLPYQLSKYSEALYQEGADVDGPFCLLKESRQPETAEEIEEDAEFHSRMAYDAEFRKEYYY